jgi:hypothetical protein
MRLKAAVLSGGGSPIVQKTNGFSDTGRFSKRRQSEIAFESRIAAAFGASKRQRLGDQPALDWKFFNIVRETRFFRGDERSHYGRKVLRPTFGDSISE